MLKKARCWGPFPGHDEAGISFQPDELEVVRRTLLGNPPTVEDPVMTDGYATGAAAAQAVGVEWRASIAYPSIVCKLLFSKTISELHDQG